MKSVCLSLAETGVLVPIEGASGSCSGFSWVTGKVSSKYDKLMLVPVFRGGASVDCKAQNWFAKAGVGGRDAPGHFQLML